MESGTETVILRGGITMRALVFLVKLLLKIAVAPVIVALTLFVWICVGIVYISGLVLGLISMVVALLGVAVLITYSPQNGIILLVMAFLISPYGLPTMYASPSSPVRSRRRMPTAWAWNLPNGSPRANTPLWSAPISTNRILIITSSGRRSIRIVTGSSATFGAAPGPSGA